jgi:hypothetical protein
MPCKPVIVSPIEIPNAEDLAGRRSFYPRDRGLLPGGTRLLFATFNCSRAIYQERSPQLRLLVVIRGNHHWGRYHQPPLTDAILAQCVSEAERSVQAPLSLDHYLALQVRLAEQFLWIEVPPQQSRQRARFTWKKQSTSLDLHITFAGRTRRCGLRSVSCSAGCRPRGLGATTARLAVAGTATDSPTSSRAIKLRIASDYRSKR